MIWALGQLQWWINLDQDKSNPIWDFGGYLIKVNGYSVQNWGRQEVKCNVMCNKTLSYLCAEFHSWDVSHFSYHRFNSLHILSLAFFLTWFYKTLLLKNTIFLNLKNILIHHIICRCVNNNNNLALVPNYWGWRPIHSSVTKAYVGR